MKKKQGYLRIIKVEGDNPYYVQELDKETDEEISSVGRRGTIEDAKLLAYEYKKEHKLDWGILIAVYKL